MMNLVSPKGKAALSIVQCLTEAGHQALFAGGCVRDYLLGLDPTDYDIATSATPEMVEKLFKKTIPVGRQFGVMLVIINALQFEVATFRTEGGYQDGRHPGFINFSNAQEDASRRDFTVNGLFYDPLNEQVLDYVHGQEDLLEKVIRCIGDPAKRFEEDKLRLLRAVRFAARLGFDIDEQTRTEIKKQASQITAVSQERIRDEVDKILSSSHVRMGLDLLLELGLWKSLWPTIDHNDVLLRFSSFDFKKKLDAPLLYAIFFYGSNRHLVADEMRRFRHSNETTRRTLHILELTEKFETFEGMRLGAKKIIAADQDFDFALKLYSKSLHGSQKAVMIQNQSAPWLGQALPQNYLNGVDLIRLGLQPCLKIGQILEEAYFLQLENKFKNPSEALDWAKTQI